MKLWIGLLHCIASAAVAQEAASGLEIRMTLSEGGAYSHVLAQSPRQGRPIEGGFRAMLYPTWKLSSHWTISGALQVHSRPYFFQEFETQGYGMNGDLLRLNVAYSRFWDHGSVAIRAGELTTAFGAFPLRYDDAANWLIDMPPSYGYYEKGVSLEGLAGAQADLTISKFDLRWQFVNSSPANRRNIFDKDQYGNWCAGAGYTIRQGLRTGVSGYRGPYLNRHSEYYFPGELKPRDLPATAYGADIEWGSGHWNVNAEYQRFKMVYHAIPTFNLSVGYVEARRVLHPRWYGALRSSHMSSNAGGPLNLYEAAIGFRPGVHELIKVGYQIQQGPAVRGTLGNTLAVQFVTTLKPVSMALN